MYVPLISPVHSLPAMYSFLRRVEAGYSAHPYHNTVHIAEVLRTMHMLLWKGGLAERLGLTDVDLLACYLTVVRGKGE
jgi:hypothetical protein